jgi:hypothetical protein
MARRRSGGGRATSPGAPYTDPLRPTRPAWIRVAVLVMVAALLLSVVAGFLSAIV